MDKSVPKPAAALLDFIGKIEAPQGYNTIYGNNQRRLPKQITKMTLDELIAAQRGFASKYGSSASGRYQFMRNTLLYLKRELKLSGNQIMDANFQDRLGFHLLKRRGYEQFMQKSITYFSFGKRLAQEWASLPVLTETQGAHRQVPRGASYYMGDKLNKSLVKPEAVEKILNAMRTGKYPMTTAEKVAVGAGCSGAVVGGTAVAVEPSIVTGGAEAVVDGAKDAGSIIDQVQPVTDTISMLGHYGMYIAGGVVGTIVLVAVCIALYKWAKK